MSDFVLEQLVQCLRPVKGLMALVLGGSRARGTAGLDSDYDLGLYYDTAAPLDVVQIRSVLEPLVADRRTTIITEPGQWGPWIDGGAWLRIDGKKVDLLYRDLSRVREVIEACRAGDVSMHYQPGHPHGFCSAIWMGEVALCLPLIDSAGVLAELKKLTEPYPAKLQDGLIRRFHWEVGFSIENAEFAVARDEQTHIGGCAYRALCCIAQVLFAVNNRYLINEKGALAETETLPQSIPRIGGAAKEIWAAVGLSDFKRALELLRGLSLELDRVVARNRGTV
jgi:predicted nucleotidyltransferase